MANKSTYTYDFEINPDFPLLRKSDYAIEIENLSKTYISGEIEVKALQDINMQIEPTERLVILGPSGAGKTTLLNLLGGITYPDNNGGFLKIFGSNIKKYSMKKLCNHRKHKIGFVFQFYNLFPALTAIENVAISIELLNIYLCATFAIRDSRSSFHFEQWDPIIARNPRDFRSESFERTYRPGGTNQIWPPSPSPPYRRLPCFSTPKPRPTKRAS